jgi:hypothetical protein
MNTIKKGKPVKKEEAQGKSNEILELNSKAPSSKEES